MLALRSATSGTTARSTPRRSKWSKTASSATSSTSAPSGTATTPGRIATRKLFDEEEISPRSIGIPYYIDSWWKEVPQEDADALPPEKLAELAFGNPEKYGFKDVAELVRWRLLQQDRRRPHGRTRQPPTRRRRPSSSATSQPLAVQGVGGKFFYGPGRNDRESDDGVFVTFEFPGPQAPQGRARAARTRTTSSSSPTPRSTPTVREVRRVRDGQPGHHVPRKGSRRVTCIGNGQDRGPAGKSSRREGENRAAAIRKSPSPVPGGGQARHGSDQHLGRWRRQRRHQQGRRRVGLG